MMARTAISKEVRAVSRAEDIMVGQGRRLSGDAPGVAEPELPVGPRPEASTARGGRGLRLVRSDDAADPQVASWIVGQREHHIGALDSFKLRGAYPSCSPCSPFRHCGQAGTILEDEQRIPFG